MDDWMEDADGNESPGGTLGGVQPMYVVATWSRDIPLLVKISLKAPIKSYTPSWHLDDAIEHLNSSALAQSTAMHESKALSLRLNMCIASMNKRLKYGWKFNGASDGDAAAVPDVDGMV
jgi:hypothetical protein